MFALENEWHDWKEYSLGYAGWDSPPPEVDLCPDELVTVYTAAMPLGTEVRFNSCLAIN